MDTAKLRAESHTAAASGYCPLGGGFGLRTGLCRIEAGFGERHLPDPWNLGLLSFFLKSKFRLLRPFVWSPMRCTSKVPKAKTVEFSKRGVSSGVCEEPFVSSSELHFFLVSRDGFECLLVRSFHGTLTAGVPASFEVSVGLGAFGFVLLVDVIMLLNICRCSCLPRGFCSDVIPFLKRMMSFACFAWNQPLEGVPSPVLIRRALAHERMTILVLLLEFIPKASIQVNVDYIFINPR